MPVNGVPLLQAGSDAAALPALSITLNIDGGFTTSQAAAFTTAVNTWASILHDYQPSVLDAGPRPSPVITVRGMAMDGAGGQLAHAMPTVSIQQGGFMLSLAGELRLDTADLANLESEGRLSSVVLHEVAHVLGFGSLWQENGLYDAGSGEYTGSNGLNAFRNEFGQPDALFVPVELGGGLGTAGTHWDEVNGGRADTGIKQAGTGRDLAGELMTGWIDMPTFISQTTIESFRDMGFAPVPEPGAIACAAGLICGALAILRRRRRTQPRP